MKFADLKGRADVLKAMLEMGFVECTEIQEKTIPPGLEGKDLIGQAMTGSGKTAAFGLPLLSTIKEGHGIQALVLTPTRELAIQVAQEMQKFARYSRHAITLVYGGVGMEPQVVALRRADVVVGTPGRILDHMGRGTLKLDRVKVLVLDEADRMLDMGFIDDIEDIIRTIPRERQTLLFSATMPDPIARLAQRYMRHPLRIRAQAQVSKEQLKHYYYDVKPNEKNTMLLELIKREKPKLALVFCATRDRTDLVARFLHQRGLEARAIHGGHTQDKREKIMAGFHKGHVRVLIATDVAARGLHIEGITHVFNYDVPKSAEDYLHRTGRTARFESSGKAITLLAQRDHDAFRKIVGHVEIAKLRL